MKRKPTSIAGSSSHRCDGDLKSRRNREETLRKTIGISLALPIILLLATATLYGADLNAAGQSRKKNIATTSTSKKIPRYSIQTGAYLIRRNADKMAASLRAKGYEPYIYVTVNNKSQKLYVVRIGDYQTIKRASFAAAQFRSLENLPTMITPYNSTTPIGHTPLARKSKNSNVISMSELANVSGGTRTVIGSDELAQIDGQTGAIIQSDELARIDGQTGTIMPTDELAQIDGQTGAVIPSDELATVDGRTGVVIPKDEMAAVDGRAGTVVPSGELANVQGQTGPSLERDDLAGIRGQAAAPDFSNDEAAPFFLSQEATEKDEPAPGNFFGDSAQEAPAAGGGAVDSETARQLKEQIEALQEKVDELREEADVRKILEITEDEKQEEEEEILSATGRDYTMAKKGSIGFDYSLNYTYNSFDTLENAASLQKIDHRATHNLTNSLSISYALRDNITFGASIPFVYLYDNMGTNSPIQTSDLGDIGLSLQWQPIKAGGSLPPGILNFGWSFPTGRSPYKINPDIEKSTGSGQHTFSAGLSLSHPMDPVVVYGGMSFTHGLSVTNLNHLRYGYTLKEVKPGQSVGIRLGLGYALSYKLTMNFNLSYNYSFGGEYVYTSGRQPTLDSASANFSLGTGWRITPKQTLNVTLSKGLSNDASDFSLNFRLPFNF